MLLDSLSPFFDVRRTLEAVDRIMGAVGRPLGFRSVPRGTFPGHQRLRPRQMRWS